MLALVFVIALNGCDSGALYRKTDSGSIITKEGIEYLLLDQEPNVYAFGELKFLGNVKGEEESFVHLITEIQTGMYSLGDSGDQKILARYVPHNEWIHFYIRSDLAKPELALENCIRFELIKDTGPVSMLPEYTYKSENGVNDKEECKRFISEVKSGQTAEEAKLSEYTLQPDGTHKNQVVYGYIYGFFDKDLNLAVRLEVTSYNGKAYSVEIAGTEYVLPAVWMNNLTDIR